MSLFLSLFIQLVMGIRIQQLYMVEMSKNGKLVEYFNIKDQVEEGSICLHIHNMTNLKLICYHKVIFAVL